MVATAFIPAKASSKRIESKNLVSLGGKPLVEWTLEACRRWGFIDQIVVATESPLITEIAKPYGVSIFKLEDQDISDLRTVSKLWKFYVEQRKPREIQVLMHCTNPFRSVSEMKLAEEAFAFIKPDILMSVKKFTDCVLNSTGNLFECDLPQRMHLLSQDREPKFLIDGSYYITMPDYISKCNYFEEGTVLPFPVSPMNTLEINTAGDLELCKLVSSIGFEQWWDCYGQ